MKEKVSNKQLVFIAILLVIFGVVAFGLSGPVGKLETRRRESSHNKKFQGQGVCSGVTPSYHIKHPDSYPDSDTECGPLEVEEYWVAPYSYINLAAIGILIINLLSATWLIILVITRKLKYRKLQK